MYLKLTFVLSMPLLFMATLFAQKMAPDTHNIFLSFKLYKGAVNDYIDMVIVSIMEVIIFLNSMLFPDEKKQFMKMFGDIIALKNCPRVAMAKVSYFFYQAG